MTDRLVPDAERTALFNATIAQEVARGARVESLGEYMAVVVYGRKVNHVLHALLSLVLCGLWLVVWLILVLDTREVRTTLTVDAYGVVHGLPEPPPSVLDSIFEGADRRAVLISVAVIATIIVFVLVLGAR